MEIASRLYNYVAPKVSMDDVRKNLTPKNVWYMTVGSMAVGAAVMHPPAWIALSATVQIITCLSLVLGNLIVAGLYFTRSVVQDTTSAAGSAVSLASKLLTSQASIEKSDPLEGVDFEEWVEDLDLPEQPKSSSSPSLPGSAVVKIAKKAFIAQQGNLTFGLKTALVGALVYQAFKPREKIDDGLSGDMFVNPDLRGF